MASGHVISPGVIYTTAFEIAEVKVNLKNRVKDTEITISHKSFLAIFISISGSSR